MVELIALSFAAAKEGKEGAEWLYPMDIKQVTDAHFKGKLANKETRVSSTVMKTFLGAESRRSATGYKYLVERKS